MQDDTGATVDLSSPATDDAETMPLDAEEKSVEKPEEKQQGGAQFGSLSPSEAASRRWEQARARKAASELSGQDDPDVMTEVRWVRVPVRTGEIIRKLNADARKGSVQAAKELRAWLADVAQDEQNRVSDLDRRTRQTLLDRLLADIEEEDEAAASPHEPLADPPTPATAGTPVV